MVLALKLNLAKTKTVVPFLEPRHVQGGLRGHLAGGVVTYLDEVFVRHLCPL